MLRNELDAIKAVVANISILCSREGCKVGMPDLPDRNQVDDLAKSLSVAWRRAAFSVSDATILKRYFSFHLKGICELSDTLFHFYISEIDPQIKPVILLINDSFSSLIIFHYNYFEPFFDFKVTAPLYFKFTYANQLIELKCKSAQKLSGSSIGNDLNQLLQVFIERIPNTLADIPASFHSIFYIESFLNRFLAFFNSPELLTDSLLTEQLSQLGFNYLPFFNYRVGLIRKVVENETLEDQLIFLRELHAGLSTKLSSNQLFDPLWPSVEYMLSGWITEEIAEIKRKIDSRKTEALSKTSRKLSVNLSVAQLAFIARLFYDEQLLNTLTLTDLFAFISFNYQTKRQHTISPGSLSKEFYSTSQVTAAVVREMLVKMIARINRVFFPVWIVIGAIIDFY